MITDDILKDFLKSFQNQKCAVSFVHSDFRTITAGTEKYVGDQMAVMNNYGLVYIVLLSPCQTAIPPQDLKVEFIADGVTIGSFLLAEIALALKNAHKAEEINLITVLINNFVGFCANQMSYFLELLDIKDLLIFYTIHDYTAICDNLFLFRNDEEFCGAPSEESKPCDGCKYGKGRQERYSQNKNFFSKYVTNFIAPSVNAKKVFTKAFPDFQEKIEIIPHDLIELTDEKVESEIAKRNFLKIAYIGRPHWDKGWNGFKALMAGADSEKYKFYHFYVSDLNVENLTHVPTDFHKGDEGTLSFLLAEHDIDVLLLWTNWFGTYNYTYYEAMKSGIFIITYKDSGNIAEQTSKNANGLVLNSLEELLEVFEDFNSLKQKISDYKNKEFYKKLLHNPALTKKILKFQDDKIKQKIFFQQFLVNVRKFLKI